MDTHEAGTNGTKEKFHDFAAAGLLQQGPGHSSSAMFIKPGNDSLELLMRTVFENDQQATAVVLLYSKCKKYKYQRGIDDLMALMAAKCSVKGRSTLLALQAETQILAPSLLGGAGKDQQVSKKKNHHDDGSPEERR